MQSFLSFSLFVVAVFAAVIILELIYSPGALALPGVDTAQLEGAYTYANQGALPHTNQMLVDVVASLGYTFSEAGNGIAAAGDVSANAVGGVLAKLGINPQPGVDGMRAIFTAPAEMFNAISRALDAAVKK